MHKVCTKARLLGERSVRIREVKGSNPSRSTFSSSVILTLLLFFCIHISHALALGPRGIRTARPCRRQGKQPAQCNGDDRSQWLKQGGAVGAAFGFFKALPRGCGKISQRNPSLLLSARVPTSRNIYRGDFRFCRIVLYDAAFFYVQKPLTDRAGLRTLKSDANRAAFFTGADGAAFAGFIPGRPAGWCGSTPWGSCRTSF